MDKLLYKVKNIIIKNKNNSTQKTREDPANRFCKIVQRKTDRGKENQQEKKK